MSGEVIFRDLGGWISGPCLDPERLPAPVSADGLMSRFGGRWEIEVRPGGLDVLTAVRRRGTETRMIGARTAEELAARLEVVDKGDDG